MMNKNKLVYTPILAALLLMVCHTASSQNSFYEQLADSTITLTQQHVVYDSRYYRMDYPNGDIPQGRGVCTDVIIRAYRMFGIDLQKLVHEDMLAHFGEYPANWGLTRPDKNIDHRRVPNLMTYFSRFGQVLPITRNASDFNPGDIVCWDLGNGITHIGLVVKPKSKNKLRHQIVHNIGAGQVMEDCLFNFKIIGHYKFFKK